MRTVRSFREIPSVVVVGTFCCFAGGCDVRHPEPTVTEKVTAQSCMRRVFDAGTRERFAQALGKASVPYEIAQATDGDGGVIFQARGSACEAMQQVKLVSLGPDLPNGRHIHFDADLEEQFKQWLVAEGIPFETQVRDGSEYVVWRAEDAPRVLTWRFFPRTNPAFQPTPNK